MHRQNLKILCRSQNLFTVGFGHEICIPSFIFYIYLRIQVKIAPVVA